MSSLNEERIESVEVLVGLLYFLMESRVWTGFDTYTYIRLCFPVLPNLYLFFFSFGGGLVQLLRPTIKTHSVQDLSCCLYNNFPSILSQFARSSRLLSVTVI